MPSFRKNISPEHQALSVAKSLQQSGQIASVRTLGNYRERLEQVGITLKNTGFQGGIRALKPDSAKDYLEIRGQEVGQKTLDMERQAIQAMMRYVTTQIDAKETLPVVKSEHAQVLVSRAYTADQVKAVQQGQTDKNRLSTEIAHAAGLRAHELYSLRSSVERSPDQRPALRSKWEGREGTLYTVQGKGGLVREVLIPHELAQRLEASRLPEPVRVTDRGVHYTQHYGINGGHRWSSSFSTASNRVLGRSEGAHGVRHSYAQERMAELQKIGYTRDTALETVSQEMGHFRPEITETYLR